MSHKKFGPDRFSRFDVYWIQTDRQAKFIYRYDSHIIFLLLSLVLSNLTKYGRRHSNLFINCRVSFFLLYSTTFSYSYLVLSSLLHLFITLFINLYTSILLSYSLCLLPKLLFSSTP